MIFRSANINDAAAISRLICSFQPVLTLDPSGRGAEQFLASVSEDAERGYIGSDRFRYLIAEIDGALAGFIAMRIARTCSISSLMRSSNAKV